YTFEALQWLHNKGYYHNDAKLDNFMMETPHTPNTIKMIDFGMVAPIDPDPAKGERNQLYDFKLAAEEFVHFFFPGECGKGGWNLRPDSQLPNSADPTAAILGRIDLRIQANIHTDLQAVHDFLQNHCVINRP